MLSALWAVLASDKGYLTVRNTYQSTYHTVKIPAADRAWYVRAAKHSETGLVPVADKHDPPVATDGACLWGIVPNRKGRAKLKILADTGLPPTFILSEGPSKPAVALWALERPIPWAYVEKGSKRLMRFLGGRLKDVSPGFLCTTRVEDHDPMALYWPPKRVVGGLPDPPRQTWRDER